MNASDYEPQRIFTVEQANAMLPLVSRITRDISDTYHSLVDKYERYQSIIPEGADGLDQAHREEVEQMRSEIDAETEALRGYAKELDDLGVLLKGEADGLVDFPALRDDRIVFLCWKSGEPRVEYWHEVEAGFRGRQTLDATEEAWKITTGSEG